MLSVSTSYHLDKQKKCR